MESKETSVPKVTPVEKIKLGDLVEYIESPNLIQVVTALYEDGLSFSGLCVHGDSIIGYISNNWRLSSYRVCDKNRKFEISN